MSRVPWLHPLDELTPFPDATNALDEPNGLLAIGGNLGPARLMEAYRHGIFPWFGPDDPILWWSPDPRAVLFIDRFRVARSLRRLVQHPVFDITFDHDFPGVIRGCAAPRRDTGETWITPAMIEAYEHLHRLGYAHSVEVWQDGALVGGLYGVAIGRVFSGESMFSRASNASKVALVYLIALLRQRGAQLVDVQQDTEHLRQFGAEAMPRRVFLDLLARWRRPEEPGSWAAAVVDDDALAAVLHAGRSG